MASGVATLDLPTLVSPMSTPSLSNSPWMRGAILAAHLRISFRVSGQTGGRPGWPRRTFQVQNTRNPLRCQSITVSGLTMTRADRQPIQNRDIPRNQHRDKRDQKNRSAAVSLGHFTEPSKTLS